MRRRLHLRRIHLERVKGFITLCGYSTADKCYSEKFITKKIDKVTCGICLRILRREGKIQ